MAKLLWYGLVSLILAVLIDFQPHISIQIGWIRGIIDFPLFHYHKSLMTISKFLSSSFMTVDGHPIKYSYLVLSLICIYFIERRVSS